MPRIKILNSNDSKVFENPPLFSGEERKRFFYLPNWASDLVENFKTPTNQAGFILQFGYFKATGRFFAAREFHQIDIEFVARRRDIQQDVIDLSRYTQTTFERHQELILINMGIKKFDVLSKDILQKEAQNLCSKQIKPRLMFLSLIGFLKSHKIEIPGYHVFE